MLHVKDISLTAGDFHLRSVSFDVKEGEYYFLLGESGSGKTLVLEAISGIARIRRGNVKVEGKDITREPFNRRNVGLVFQNLALFPHKTVFRNIAFSLENNGEYDRKRIAEEVAEIAEKLSIGKLFDRFPGALSGGERQRVALARTLVMKPKVLLLDEPLSSLDILLKEEMTDLLNEINNLGQTILHVTHDYQVVAKLAHRLSIIEGGKLIQTGTPREIASSPKCRLAEKISKL